MSKTIAPKPATPFPDRLPWPVSHWPTRKRTQSVVSKAEREGVVRLLEQYRGLEALAAENDIAAISQHVADLEQQRRFPEALETRRRLEKCDHTLFTDAQERMHSIRNIAADDCVTILERLYTSMDDKLAEYAAVRERNMERMGISLFNERRLEKTDTSMVVNGMARSLSHTVRDWRLVDDAECQALWVPRNAVSHLLNMLNHGVGGWTPTEVRQARGVATLEYLCTDQPCAGFSWV